MRLLASCLTLCALISCSEVKTEPSAITKTQDDIVYHNEYLDVSVTKPQDWYSQSPEDTMKMSQQGSEVLSGDDQNMKAMVDASLKSSLPVFAFFEFEPGTPGKLNPNILSMAENIELAPGVKTGCDYLAHTRTLLENSAIQVSFEDGCTQTMVGGASMGTLNVQMNMNNILINQTYYACIKGDHAITVIKTYFDEQSKQKVDGVQSSLKLSCS